MCGDYAKRELALGQEMESPPLVRGLLTQCIIKGKSPQSVISEISKRFEVSKSQAGNLVMTECAFFSSAAQKDSFNALDVEEFEIVATLDNHTSIICKDLDGKHFKMKDFKPGITAPPFHCRCRSTTCPYFADEKGLRAAKDKDGKYYTVPDDMDYEEWAKEHIEDSIPDNVYEQYDKYKNALGDKWVPANVVEFYQDKQCNAESYQLVKTQYRSLTYYNKEVDNEPAITNMVKNVSKETDSSLLGLDYRIKKKDTYLGKIAREFEPSKNTYEINDIIRYTASTNADSLVA